MRINIEEELWTDPRALRVIAELKWSMRELIGTLATIWYRASRTRSEHMLAEDVDTFAETQGFADAMVRHKLADEVLGSAGLLRLRGVLKRIAYLDNLAKQGAKGGKAKAANAKAAKAKAAADAKAEAQRAATGASAGLAGASDVLAEARTAVAEAGDSLARPSKVYPLPLPLPLPLALNEEGARSARARVIEPTPDKPADSDTPPPVDKPGKPGKPVSPPGLSDTIAAFDGAYRSQNAGAKPTWGAKQSKQLGDLVRGHGADEVQRRIAVLFDGRGPAFLAAPFDVGTLVQHFDKLAAPSGPRGGQPAPRRINALE